MTTIEQAHAEGRIIRKAWGSTCEDGRQLLCLYTALVGDPGGRPETCPAHLCPRWLAHLLPWIDDAGSEEAWPGVVSRVVALAPHLATLPSSLEWRVRALCVREAMRHTTDSETLAVCERVASLCEARGRGGRVADSDFAEAAAEAWAGAAAAAADRLIDAILTEVERTIGLTP